MAVQIESKKTHSTEEILAAFAIDSDLIKKVKNAGLSVVITPKGLKVVDGSNTVGNIPLKAGAALLALEGSIAKASLQSVAYKIMGTLNPLVAAKKTAGYAEMYGAGEKVVEEVVAKAQPSTLKEAITAKKKPSFKKPAVAAAEVAESKGKVIPLSMASELYQQVKGTSANSIYVVFALSPELKVAARYTGTSLSVRAEGNVAALEDKLVAAGIGEDKGGYASVHLACESELIARRALGSLLSGLDVQWTSPWPDFKKVSGGV